MWSLIITCIWSTFLLCPFSLGLWYGQNLCLVQPVYGFSIILRMGTTLQARVGFACMGWLTSGWGLKQQNIEQSVGNEMESHLCHTKNLKSKHMPNIAISMVHILTEVPLFNILSQWKAKTLYVETVGPLATCQGFNYILTTLDPFTGWWEAIPM